MPEFKVSYDGTVWLVWPDMLPDWAWNAFEEIGSFGQFENAVLCNWAL